MKNGYFQLVIAEQGTGVRILPPEDGGTPVPIGEVREYLDKRGVTYDLVALNNAVEKADGTPVILTNAKIMPEREAYRLTISEDEMTATGYFYPPSIGAQGESMTADEVIKDLHFQQITYGIQNETIEAFFKDRTYCTEIVLAQGKPPRQGTDAVIEYFFETERSAKPQMNEDGTVDFFNLDLISHCKEGDKLAQLTPEDTGEDGWNIYNKPVMPEPVKHLDLKFNKNCVLSEDKLTVTAGVNGHVALVKGVEVAVSNVFTVEAVDVATGNIDYDGSVVVKGNVEAGFTVKAIGDIEVKGSVAGAILKAKGNVVLSRGISGMGKGEITAGGNVVSKFIEAATVKAKGNVSAESIMRSTVHAGKEIFVDGRKGFIAGSQVAARERVTAKTLGSEMGAKTLIEVGADPTLKENVKKMQAQITEAEKKKEAIAGPLGNMLQLIKRGAQLKPEQQKYTQQLLMQNKILDQLIEKNTTAIEAAQKQMQDAKKAEVIVMETAYPGTTIGISDLSMEVKSPTKFTRFVIKEGEIRIAPV